MIGLCPRFYFEHDDVQDNLFPGEWMIEVDHSRIIRQGEDCERSALGGRRYFPRCNSLR